MKLVTGVEISTRPVNKSGSPGNDMKRRRRTAAAAPNRAAFLLSIFMEGYGYLFTIKIIVEQPDVAMSLSSSISNFGAL